MTTDTTLRFLQPLDTQTRGVAVLDALAEMIEQAGLQVGDRLPPEVSLANALGVGRSTIREALNRWEGLGAIRRRKRRRHLSRCPGATVHRPGTNHGAAGGRGPVAVSGCQARARARGSRTCRAIGKHRTTQTHIGEAATPCWRLSIKGSPIERRMKPFTARSTIHVATLFSGTYREIWRRRSIARKIFRWPIRPSRSIHSLPTAICPTPSMPEILKPPLRRLIEFSDVVVAAIRSVIGDAGQKVPTRKRRDLAAG